MKRQSHNIILIRRSRSSSRRIELIMTVMLVVIDACAPAGLDSPMVNLSRCDFKRVATTAESPCLATAGSTTTTGGD